MKAQRLNEHKGQKSKDFKTQFQTINKQNKTGNKMKKLIALALVVLLGANFAYAQTPPNQDEASVGASATINVTPIAIGTVTDLDFGTFTIEGAVANTNEFASASIVMNAQTGAVTSTGLSITGLIGNAFGVVPVTGMQFAQFTVTIPDDGVVLLENGEGEVITLTLTGYTSAGAIASFANPIELTLGDNIANALDIQFGGTLTGLFDGNNVSKTGEFTGQFTVTVDYI